MKNTKIPAYWQTWNIKRYQAAKSYFPDIVDHKGSKWTKVEIIPYILDEWEL